MTDKTREDFEAWWRERGLGGEDVQWEAYQAATQQSAARIEALEAERADFRDASKVNFENYEFQRRKADAATATVYQFHYAMKDAGWHPGRTDDNLCDIIRAKGAELAKLEAEVLALRKDAERWRTFLATRPANTHAVIIQAIDDAAVRKGGGV